MVGCRDGKHIGARFVNQEVVLSLFADPWVLTGKSESSRMTQAEAASREAVPDNLVALRILTPAEVRSITDGEATLVISILPRPGLAEKKRKKAFREKS